MRRYAVPAIAALFLFAIAAGVGYLTAEDAASSPSQTAVSAEPGATRGAIQSVDATILRITVDGATHEFALGADAPIEVLRPATKTEMTTNDWLNVGSIPNTQNVFTITGLTLIAESMVRTP